MQRSKRATVLAAVSAAVAQFSLIQFNANAATFTWDGGGGDGNWPTLTNWVGDSAAPTIGDAAIFTGNVGTSVTVDASRQVSNVTFDANAVAFTIGGSTLTLGAGTATAGTIVNNGTLITHTFNNAVALYAGTINAAQGGLVFNGPVNIGNGGTLSANNVIISGNSTVAFNGGLVTSIVDANNALQVGVALSGGNDQPSSFNGTLTIGNDNSAFAGQVFINGGALRIANGNAVGSTGTITTALASGGTGKGVLELEGNITVNKTVTTRARSGGNVMIRNLSGNNTITNVTTNTGGSTFSYESSGGNLTITNWNTSLTGTNRFLNLTGAGNGQINNWTFAAGTTMNPIKAGTGQWTLGAGMSGGTFSSATVNGGTLVFDGNLGTRLLGNATINTGGALRVVSTDGTTGEVGNAVTPTTIAIANGGTLDASTFSNYSLQAAQQLRSAGTVKVGGQLSVFGDNQVHVGGATAAGTMNVQGTLALSNAFSATGGGLYFDLGNATTVGSGVNDLLSVAGPVTVDNSGGAINVRINPLQTTFANGSYRLIDFTGGATLNPSDFTLVGAPTGGRQNFALATAANQLNLNVTGTTANLVWNGTAPAGNWDIQTSTNWLNGATPDKFFQSDAVTFTDAAANKTVNIVGAPVQPSTVNVNTTAAYTFTGSGGIGGTTGLVKDGTGTLTINTANTYTGTTTLNAGGLNINNGSAIGTGAFVVNGGSIDNTSGGGVALATNNAQSWNADVAFAGSNPLDMGSGNVTVGGTGTDRTVTVTANTLTVGEVRAATQGLIKAGAGTLVLTSTGIAAADGSIINGTLNVAAGTLQMNRAGGAGTLSGDVQATGLIGNGTIINGAADVRWLFINNATDSTFAGALVNGGGAALGLNKGAAGKLTLTGANNSYTDVTTVNAGTLVLPSNIGPGTNLVNNAGATVLAGATSLGTTNAANPGEANNAAALIRLNGVNVSTLTFASDTPGTTYYITGGSGTASAIILDRATPGAAVDRTLNTQLAANGVGNVTFNLTPGANTTSGTPRLTFLQLGMGSGSTGTLLLNPVGTNVTVGTGGAQKQNNDVSQTLGLGGTSQDNHVLGVISNGTALVTATNAISLAKSDTSKWTVHAVNTYTGTTTVSGGILEVANTGLLGAGTATVNNGGSGATLSFAAGNTVAEKFAALTVGPVIASYVDMNDNDMVVGSGTAKSAIEGYVATGRNAGGWNGPQGIISSNARLNPNHTTGIGVLSGAEYTSVGNTGTFSGQAYADTDTLVKYTWNGDANLDGRVTFDDYVKIDTGFNTHLTGWLNGDFNYSGGVNFDDYVLIDIAFNQQNGTLGRAIDWISGDDRSAAGLDGDAMRTTLGHIDQFGTAYGAAFLAAVPEPTLVGVASVVGSAALLRRRRRQG